VSDPNPDVSKLLEELEAEVARQDRKHGPFEGTPLGRSRLAIACLEDEVREAGEAWRDERPARGWNHTRAEVLQVAAVAIRGIRDAFPFSERQRQDEIDDHLRRRGAA
jgi:hypothetical protein